jgi:serine/threonine protein kinase
MSESDDNSEKSESASDDRAPILKMNSTGDSLTEFVDDAAEQNNAQPPAKMFSIGDPATRLSVSPNESQDSYGNDPNFGFTNVNFLKHFRFERALGKGGMGEVYLATDTRLHRQVAVKRIRVERASSNTAVSRFLNEAKALARFSHPNLVQIYEYGEDDAGPYLVMEHVDGSTLLDRCKSGPMDEIEAVELICNLCDALEKVHAKDILHRDIKPANILLTTDRIPKLTDFGLAKEQALQASYSIEGAVVGTYGFMSPEQEDGKEVDARSDQWSLAATLYQMLTGESPRKINISKLPQSLRSVIDKALSERPENRFTSIVDFREALEKSSNSLYDLSIELKDGQCVKCQARNRADRKICDRCGTTLLAKGIGCGHEVRVWEARCDECGQEQAPLLEKVRLEKVADQRRAEALVESLDFSEAIEIAEQMKSDDDIRFDHFKTWAERFLLETEGKRASMQAEVEKCICQALDLESAFDDDAALEVLKEIPEKLRDQSVSVSDQTITTNELTARIQIRLSEVTRLESEIHRLDSERPEIPELESGQWIVNVGLSPDVLEILRSIAHFGILADQLMALRPDHELLRNWRKNGELDKRLQNMPKLVEERADDLFNRQHYKECLHLFETFETVGSKWCLLTPASLEIKKQSKQLQERVDTLRELIGKQIEAGQYNDQLVSRIEECCALQKFDEDLANLRNAVQRKVRQQQVLVSASQLLDKKRFRECIALLDRTEAAYLPDNAAELRHIAMIKTERIEEIKNILPGFEVAGYYEVEEELEIKRVRSDVVELLAELFDLDPQLQRITEIAGRHFPPVPLKSKSKKQPSEVKSKQDEIEKVVTKEISNEASQVPETRNRLGSGNWLLLLGMTIICSLGNVIAVPNFWLTASNLSFFLGGLFAASGAIIVGWGTFWAGQYWNRITISWSLLLVLIASFVVGVYQTQYHQMSLSAAGWFLYIALVSFYSLSLYRKWLGKCLIGEFETPQKQSSPKPTRFSRARSTCIAILLVLPALIILPIGLGIALSVVSLQIAFRRCRRITILLFLAICLVLDCVILFQPAPTHDFLHFLSFYLGLFSWTTLGFVLLRWSGLRLVTEPPPAS